MSDAANNKGVQMKSMQVCYVCHRGTSSRELLATNLSTDCMLGSARHTDSKDFQISCRMQQTRQDGFGLLLVDHQTNDM